MHVEIDPRCGEIKQEWIDWLLAQKTTSQVSLRTSQGEFYLKPTSGGFLFTILPTRVPLPLHWGIAMWKEFHETAWAGKMTESYLLDFESRIPNGCGCTPKWHKVWKENPFNQVAPKEWSVKVHNLVNKELNKPQFSYEQADKLYAKL